MDHGAQSRTVRRYSEGDLSSPTEDQLVVEEPLEIRYDGEAIATIMRTPGDDRDLALGYLFVEGWVDSVASIGTLSHCARIREDEKGEGEGDRLTHRNVVDFRPAPGSPPPAQDATRRNNTSTSSCGICGKTSIDDAMLLRSAPAGADQTPTSAWISAALIAELGERLRAEQDLFRSTGALHAAGLFDRDGTLVAVREDIGRHNAVDKVIGWSFREELLPASRHVLQVSGRVSFEIVQKAYRAGIPVIVAVSGVSSLAADFAKEIGMTLIGFARGDRFVVYSGDAALEV